MLRNFYKVTQRSGDKNSKFISLFLGEIQYMLPLMEEKNQWAIRQGF